MARTKRFQRVRWARTSEAIWLRIPTGRPEKDPLSEAYRREYLSHKDDEMEVILGETRDWHGRRLLLAKWKGFPKSEATWVIEVPF
jgi:hypothetical protein